METRLALDCSPGEEAPIHAPPRAAGLPADSPLPGLSPLCRLKRSRLKVRFCTNESQKSRADLVGLLRRLGFDVSEGEVTAPAPAACLILKQRGLRPHLLVHDGRPPLGPCGGEGAPFPAGGWGGHRGSTWPLLDLWALMLGPWPHPSWHHPGPRGRGGGGWWSEAGSIWLLGGRKTLSLFSVIQDGARWQEIVKWGKILASGVCVCV